MIGSSDNSLIFTMAAFNITYLNIFLMKTGNVMPDLLAAKLFSLIYIIKLTKMCFGPPFPRE